MERRLDENKGDKISDPRRLNLSNKNSNPWSLTFQSLEKKL